MRTETNLRIWLNGAGRAIAPGTTVDALVHELGLRPEVVAVEVDERLVPRSERGTRVLREGERVEVVTLVGGG
jgi:sulfur carrier protein